MEERLTPGLLQNLNSVMNITSRLFNKIIKTCPVPLSLPEYTILWTVYDSPGQTQYRISQISGYSAQRCHQIINTLEDSGLLEKDHEPYGNKTMMSLTPKGLEVMESLMNQIQTILREHLAMEDIGALVEINSHISHLSQFMMNSKGIQKFIR